MQFIKCSVNILLLIILAAAEVPWHLELFFSHHTMHTHTHASCNKTALQICFCVVIGETRHHAQTRVPFGTFVYSGLLLAPL